MPRAMLLAISLSLLTAFQNVEAQAPAAPAPAAQPTAPEPGATIRSNVQEVVLELIVRDSRGRQVKNLSQNDLKILEDGVPQEIRSFRQVNGRQVVVERQTAAENRKKAEAPGVRANPLSAANLLCIVLHNLDPYNKKYAVDAVREYLKTQTPDTWIGIFSLDTHLVPLHPFTTNRNELIQAASNAFTGMTVDFMSVANALLSAFPNEVVADSGNGPAGHGSIVTGEHITGGGLNASAIVGADVSNSASADLQRGDLAGQRRQFSSIEGMRATDQVLDLIQHLAMLPGRKSVLLLSPGLPTTGDPDMFKSLLDKANRAHVTVYAMDINGLSQNSNGLASTEQLSHTAAVSATQRTASGSASDMMERMRQGDYAVDAVRTTDTQASLRALSEGTGGFLIGGTNDFRKSFLRLNDDLNAHYEVVYRPSSEKYDGRLRTIAVKLDRPDWNVESRTGYFAMPDLGGSPDLTPFEMTGLAALNLRTPPHAFDFATASLLFRPGAENTQRAMVFEVRAGNLLAAPEANAKNSRIHAALVAVVKDSNGEIVDKFSQDSPYEIPSDKLAAAQNSTFMFKHVLNLPAGKYTVDTAALDREANRASTSHLEFENPDVKGIGLSSVVLVQRVEPVQGKADASDPFQFQADATQARRVIPELKSTITSDAHPYVYFVVYPHKGQTEKPKIQVEFIVNGQVLAKQAAELPPADASGAIPMVIGAAAKPGECELKITAIQGSESMHQSVKYTVIAKSS